MKTKFLLISIVCFSLTTLLFSQSQFQVAIGFNSENANSISRTADGGYVVGGCTYEQNNFCNMEIIKLYSSGSLQWSKNIGIENSVVWSIIQTTDGGYAVAGFATGVGSCNMCIVKLNSSGSLQWNKTIGGTGPDAAYSIIQTTDGGYAVAGRVSSFGAGNYDMYIVKLDNSGSLQWSKTIGGTGDDEAYSIIQTTDGGYALAGWTNSFGAGNHDFFIVKLDASGSLQWCKTVGGTGDDGAYSIIQTTDGGYTVAGYTLSFGLGHAIFIIKLNASGSLQWSKTIGSAIGTYSIVAWTIIQTTDGGYATAGYTNTFGAGGSDMYIVKLDASGSIQWNNTIGGTSNDFAYSIIQTTDDGYAVAGYTYSFGYEYNPKMYIVKLDASGNTCGNTNSPTEPVITQTPTITTPSPTITSPIPVVTTPTPTVSGGGELINICTAIGINKRQSKIPI